MATKPRNPIELRRVGFQALVDRLGAADAIRFMQQFDMGEGDYTRDRRQWLGSATIDEIVRDIESAQPRPLQG